MNIRDKSILEHILDYCNKLIYYTDGISSERFVEDDIRIDACAMGILQIGELVRNLTDEFKDTHKEIPWKQIRAMRNIVAHHYGEVDAETVWDTIKEDIPSLKEFCEKML